METKTWIKYIRNHTTCRVSRARQILSLWAALSRTSRKYNHLREKAFLKDTTLNKKALLENKKTLLENKRAFLKNKRAFFDFWEKGTLTWGLGHVQPHHPYLQWSFLDVRNQIKISKFFLGALFFPMGQIFLALKFPKTSPKHWYYLGFWIKRHIFYLLANFL